jgi:GNAT superfamily N-acetyltransferase
MDLTWLDPNQPDQHDVAGAVAVEEAARAADTPQRRPILVSTFLANLTHGWDGDPRLYAVTREGSRIVGVLEVELPSWDNTHVGFVAVTIDPTARRRGLGRLLFDAGVERVRAEGRSLVLSECFDETPGMAFLEGMGFEQASVAANRRQDLTAARWTDLDELYADAEAHADGYELVRIAGQTPEDMLSAVATLSESINDAPTDDLDIEDEAFPPERIRAMEVAQQARGQRLYRLLARHRDTGELAGHTMVGVEVERPWFGSQLDTSVARGHRGHRLGLLLKIAMLRWLGDAEPQLRDLSTWNAESNSHMVRVNEAMGYAVVLRAVEWQRRI